MEAARTAAAVAMVGKRMTTLECWREPGQKHGLEGGLYTRVPQCQLYERNNRHAQISVLCVDRTLLVPELSECHPFTQSR